MPKSKKENIEEMTLDPIEEKVKEPAPVEEPVEEPVEPEAIEEGEDITEPDEFIEPEEGEQGEDVEFDEEAGEEETDEDAPEEDAPPFLGLMLGAKNAPVSEDPDPQSRIEALLWHIINGTTTDAEPQSRNEAILTAIANSGTYTAEAQSRIEALLIAILNHEEVNITPISRNEAILKAIANSGEYDEEPQSRNEELLLKWLEAWGVVIETASGAIANFITSVVKPLVNLKAYFEATGGGGTPASPIAISGVSAVVVGHQSGQSDWAECFRGLFKGTHSFIDLGSLSWTYQSATQRFVSSRPDQATYSVGEIPSYATPPYTTIAVMNSAQWNNYTGDKAITFLSSNYFVIRDKSYTDAIDLKAALDGVYLIYKLATPVTPTITPAQFQALCTAFGINGSTTLINLGGTYYGGYVEQDKDGKRELVVTHGLFEFDGSNDEEWNKYTVNTDQTMWRTSIPERKSGELAQTGNIDSICNRFDRAANTSAGRIQGKYAGALTHFDVIYNDVSDLTAWRTWLANNPIQLAVELAEPFTVALPDGEPIIAFNGVNNVWNDSGDTSVEYKKKPSD